MARKRMTWEALRGASAPPACPGYDEAGKEHPADQGDPNYEDYAKGSPDEWAETPNPPPYPEGNPPADPGYDTADQDHPAHKRNPRVPKEASELRIATEKKAAKCIRIAEIMLGKEASPEAIEEQALTMMDLPDQRINDTLNRMGIQVEAEQQSVFDSDPAIERRMAAMEREIRRLRRAAGEDEEDEKEGKKKKAEDDEDDPEDEKEGKKKADQNDPDGDTLDPTPKSEDAVKSEAKGTEKGEAKSAHPLVAWYDSMDTDNDGFVTKDDWKGPKAMFASLDHDNDGILARSETVNAFNSWGCGDSEMGMDMDMDMDMDPMMDEGYGDEGYGDDDILDEFETEGLDDDEMMMLAEMAKAAKAKKSEDDPEEDPGDEIEGKKKKGGEVPEAFKKQWDKGDDKKDDKEDKADEKESGKKKKAEDDSEDDESEDEIEGKKKADAAVDEAAVFAMTSDPMGLSYDASVLPEEDDAVLQSILAGDMDMDDDGDEEDDGDEIEGKKKKADDLDIELRPQPKAASEGVKTLGSVRTAGARNEVAELEKMWESAPDVSDCF